MSPNQIFLQWVFRWSHRASYVDELRVLVLTLSAHLFSLFFKSRERRLRGQPKSERRAYVDEGLRRKKRRQQNWQKWEKREKGNNRPHSLLTQEVDHLNGALSHPFSPSARPSARPLLRSSFRPPSRRSLGRSRRPPFAVRWPPTGWHYG